MSIHVISWVLEHSNATGNDRLALIVFADHASSDGTETYPSADCIAYEGRMARSTAVECRKRLEAQGRIVHTGFHDKGMPEYRVRMDVDAEGPPPDRRRRKGGPDSDPTGVRSGDPGGSGSAVSGGPDPGPEPSLEPSREPSEEPSGADAPDLVLSLFESWRSALGLTNGTRLTDPRRTKLRARLAEPAVIGPTRADDLRAAIAFVTGSKWHRENGHVELTMICRSADQIEKYLQRAGAASAATSTMGKYDQAIQ